MQVIQTGYSMPRGLVLLCITHLCPAKSGAGFRSETNAIFQACYSCSFDWMQKLDTRWHSSFAICSVVTLTCREVLDTSATPDSPSSNTPLHLPTPWKSATPLTGMQCGHSAARVPLDPACQIFKPHSCLFSSSRELFRRTPSPKLPEMTPVRPTVITWLGLKVMHRRRRQKISAIGLDRERLCLESAKCWVTTPWSVGCLESLLWWLRQSCQEDFMGR